MILYIALLTTKKDDTTKNQFDERQEPVRGRGYRYGFITLAGCNLFSMLLYELEIALPVILGLQLFSSILLGVFIHTSYCIRNDEYFALNEKRGAVAVFMASGSLLNLLIGIIGILGITIFVNGQLTITSLNLFAGIICTALFIEVIMKQA